MHGSMMPPLMPRLSTSSKQAHPGKAYGQDIELGDFSGHTGDGSAALKGDNGEDSKARDFLLATTPKHLRKPNRRNLRHCALTLPQKFLKSPRYLLMTLYEPVCFFTLSMLTMV